MIRHYVEFFRKKNNYEEVVIQEIEERKVNKSQTPEGTFAYRFYDCIEREYNGATRLCNPQNYSAKTYYGNEYTKEEILKNFAGDTSILLSMNMTGATKAVKTCNGVWKPLRKGDIVIHT